MSFHSRSLTEVLEQLSVEPDMGLSTDQISMRREYYGENVLREKKRKSNLRRFWDQFRDMMILILMIAAIVSFVVVCIEGNWGELFEPVLILLIVVLNAAMGVYQESKAEKALEALKKMSTVHARVLRNGKNEIVDARQLVPGDIIHLEAGDFVPADCRLIRSAGLKSDESALTGESVPSEKNATSLVEDSTPLGDRTNMVFSGCAVTYGTAMAVVTATGMDTEMGKIANLLDNESDSQTPLQQKLARLGKSLGLVALAVCAVIFAVGVANQIPALEIFMTAVSLAVAAVPEGLPAIVTIVLSIGVQRMVKKNALIRKLSAVETLGSASVICSDKTGTLTQNCMTLAKVWTEDMEEPQQINSSNADSVRYLLMCASLCCDSTVIVQGDRQEYVGDPTETAIVRAACNAGMHKEELDNQCPRIGELPFDSDRKLMSTVNCVDGKLLVIVKGAFDMLAQRCIKGELARAKELTEAMGSEALRVLAVAVKEIDTLPSLLSSDHLENGLTFLGLLSMIDPPRPEAKNAVKICRRAGIKPVMITGDHIVTASAIARELRILTDDDLAITGSELDTMTDGELDGQVENIRVYARVSPENKLRIVKAWQRKGHVVAMTGDGVNDAPALKAADIGCAMGITGTDVAKDVADMTLTDDNFATIVDAVREGRGIYANIKKVVGFLLGTNIGEVMSVFASMLLWHKTPLLSMQLLWINLVTDSLPAIALGMEAVEKNVMDRQPKPKGESILGGRFGICVVLQGMMFAILTLIGFRLGEQSTGTLEGGQTLAFMILSLSQVVQAFNMRSERSLFQIGLLTNKKLNGAAIISAVMVAMVLFTPLRYAFGLITLRWELYVVGFGLILVPFVLTELCKFVGLLSEK